MRLLVFGRTGQLGIELGRALPPGWSAERLGRDDPGGDLTDPAACAEAVRRHAPDAVINAAAHTAVDRAETEEALATTINAEAPGAMARACAAAGIPLLHVSTDYVFSGSGTRPWQPDDAPAPLGAYGRSKLAGEAAVRAAGGQHAILRTSWVFSAQGANFLRTMLRLGAGREVLRVVADQTGGPTPAADLAQALLRMAAQLRADPGLSGTWHFAGAPDASWADFARAIMAEAGLACRIEDITTAEYPTPARRPANSRLDCTSLTRTFGIPRPDWRAGLRQALETLKGPQP